MPLSINQNPQEALIKSIKGKTKVSTGQSGGGEYLLPYNDQTKPPHASKTTKLPTADALPISKHPEYPPARYIHSDVSEIEGTLARVHFFIKPKPVHNQRWLLRVLTRVVNSRSKTPTAPPFKFELSKDAAKFNHEHLKITLVMLMLSFECHLFHLCAMNYIASVKLMYLLKLIIYTIVHYGYNY